MAERTNPPAGTTKTADSTPTRRLLALLAVAVVPWTVLATGDLVFAWGLATLDPVHVTTLPRYLFVLTAGLPQRLLAWPVAVLAYLFALGNAALGAVAPDLEDRRVTGSLLAVAGASDLWFALGMARQSRLLVVPVGTVVLWAVAWWFYWPALRTAVWPTDA